MEDSMAAEEMNDNAFVSEQTPREFAESVDAWKADLINTEQEAPNSLDLVGWDAEKPFSRIDIDTVPYEVVQCKTCRSLVDPWVFHMKEHLDWHKRIEDK